MRRKRPDTLTGKAALAGLVLLAIFFGGAVVPPPSHPATRSTAAI